MNACKSFVKWLIIGARSVLCRNVESSLAPFRATVEAEWIDLNNHMTFWAYAMLFDRSANEYFSQNEILAAPGSGRGELRTSDQHLKFRRECFAGDPLEISVQILGFGETYIHVFQRMRNRNDGQLLAVEESLKTNYGGSVEQPLARREEPFPANALAKIALLAKEHSRLVWPVEAGAAIKAP